MYFDYAATSLVKPKCVIDAVVNAMTSFGNPSRGAYKESIDALVCITKARMEIAKFFGADSEYEVAFCQNATMALNTVINSINGHIVTTAMEHNSVLRPIYKKGNYSIVPVDNMGVLDLNELESMIKKDTKAVVITHASNVTGNVNDIKTIGEICYNKNIFLVVDVAQSAGLLPIDMKEMKISAVCFSGHKSLYAPQGTGGICVSKNLILTPSIVGGSGYDSYSTTFPEDMPAKLEAGTQNSHGIAGLMAGVNYVKDSRQEFLEYALSLSNKFVMGISDISGLKIYGDFKNPIRTPIVTISSDNIDSSELAYMLYDKYNICVRAGAHCAPLIHKALGSDQKGAVRFSFSHMNTEEEIEFAIESLKKLFFK